MLFNKIDLPNCLVVFFVVCPRLRSFWSVFGELALFWCHVRVHVMSLGRLWSSKTLDTQMAMRVSRLRRSRARALLSLNLKKKRDCSQSIITIFLVSFNLQSSCLMQSAVCSLQSAVCGLRSAVCGLRSAVCSLQSANVIHRWTFRWCCFLSGACFCIKNLFLSSTNFIFIILFSRTWS